MIAAIDALAAGKWEPLELPGDDDLALVGQAINRALLRIRQAEAETGSTLTRLANANVRAVLWMDAVERIGKADQRLHNGEKPMLLYSEIVRDTMEMTRANHGALALYDSTGQIVTLVTQGLGEEAEGVEGKTACPATVEGLLHMIYRGAQPLRLDNLTACIDSHGITPGQPPTRCLLGVTLKVEGLAKGVLYLANKESGTLFSDDEVLSDSFTAEDESFLCLFAGYVERMIERLEMITALTAGNRALQAEKTEQGALIKKLEEAQNQLLQSEKMASIGQLAAGVAHEINNPIGYVNSNLGSLKKYIRDVFSVLEVYALAETTLETSNPDVFGKVKETKKRLDLDFIREDIDALMKESAEGLTRVKKIVQDLKDFSHVDEAEWQLSNLHEGLDSTLNVVWNELKYKAEVKKDYSNLPEVECLPSQLNQVFMNMLVNAAHAIKERGTIHIRTGVAGEQVWIEIEDSGSGIPPESLKRIFDPFYTTKPVGKGTGLGLSLSYNIVQKHHGRIEVVSEVGKGSRFRLFFPVKQPPPDQGDGGVASGQQPHKEAA